MTLQGLLTGIGQIGINDRMINFAGAGGSIYELNDLDIRNYPILYVSPTGTHRISDNYTTYELSIFYIDRLADDSSNAVDIHSTAIEVLKNIIRKASLLDGVVGISEEYTIQLFTETEKMKDRCNGAYATVSFTIINDSACVIYSEDEPAEFFTDPERTIMGSPEGCQIYYKTVGEVVFPFDRITPLIVKDSNGRELNLLSNTYEGEYGILTYDGDIYYGQPFICSDMLLNNIPGGEQYCVTEIVLPSGGYGRLGSNGTWALSDYYLKSIYIPEGTTYIERTECVYNGAAIKNLILPSTFEEYGNMSIIDIKPKTMKIYFNNTVERWKEISQPRTAWRALPLGTPITCLDGEYIQE